MYKKVCQLSRSMQLHLHVPDGLSIMVRTPAKKYEIHDRAVDGLRMFVPASRSFPHQATDMFSAAATLAVTISV